MNKEDLIDIEKTYFSSIHSNFSKFINNIKNPNKSLDSNILKKIIILNKKFNEIDNLLQNINFSKEICFNIENELEEYEKNDKAIQQFLPYILYYRMLLDNKN
jgi:hypothetical protein